MQLPQVRVLDGLHAVCRLPPDAAAPEWIPAAGALVSVTRTRAELSVVCPAGAVPEGVRAERDWRVLEVAGPLDFALVGVLAGLTVPLARAGIPVFAISTFDTDYLLVREHDVGPALAALAAQRGA